MYQPSHFKQEDTAELHALITARLAAYWMPTCVHVRMKKPSVIPAM